MAFYQSVPEVLGLLEQSEPVEVVEYLDCLLRELYAPLPQTDLFSCLFTYVY